MHFHVLSGWRIIQRVRPVRVLIHHPYSSRLHRNQGCPGRISNHTCAVSQRIPVQGTTLLHIMIERGEAKEQGSWPRTFMLVSTGVRRTQFGSCRDGGFYSRTMFTLDERRPKSVTTATSRTGLPTPLWRLAGLASMES